MDQFRVRLRRVNRHGGADVRVIDGQFANRSTDNRIRTMLAESSASLPSEVSGLVGFVLIGWDAEGWCITHVLNSVASPVRSHMLPVFIAEKLREQTAVSVALEAFNQQHQSR